MPNNYSFRGPDKELVEIQGRIIDRRMTKAEALDVLEGVLRAEGRHVPAKAKPLPPGWDDFIRAPIDVIRGDLNSSLDLSNRLIDRFLELHPEHKGQDCFALTKIEQGTRNAIVRELWGIPMGWRITWRNDPGPLFEARPAPAGEPACSHGVPVTGVPGDSFECFECMRDTSLDTTPPPLPACKKCGKQIMTAKDCYFVIGGGPGVVCGQCRPSKTLAEMPLEDRLRAYQKLEDERAEKIRSGEIRLDPLPKWICCDCLRSFSHEGNVRCRDLNSPISRCLECDNRRTGTKEVHLGMRAKEIRIYKNDKPAVKGYTPPKLEADPPKGSRLMAGQACPHCGMTFEFLRAQGAQCCRRLEDIVKWLQTEAILHYCDGNRNYRLADLPEESKAPAKAEDRCPDGCTRDTHRPVFWRPCTAAGLEYDQAYCARHPGDRYAPPMMLTPSNTWRCPTCKSEAPAQPGLLAHVMAADKKYILDSARERPLLGPAPAPVCPKCGEETNHVPGGMNCRG